MYETYVTDTVRKKWGLEKTHVNDASIIALCDSIRFDEDIRQYTQWLDENITINFKQYYHHVRTWVNQHEDWKYYIDGFKNSRKVFAWNRTQAKDKQSLTEYLINNNSLNKVQIIAKPGRTIYHRSNRDILFRRGDIIRCPKGTATVQYYMLRHKEIITVQFGKIKQKYCTKILNNSEMCVI